MSILYFFDMFGSDRNFKVLGKEKYNTKLSSFLSILLLLLLIFKLYKVIIKIITKKSYTLKTTFISDSNLNVNIKEFQFAICATNKDFNQFIDWDNNFTAHFMYLDIIKDQNNTHNIINNCDKQKFNFFFNKTEQNYDFNKCLCYSIDNNTNISQINEINGKNYGVYIKNNSIVSNNISILFYYIDNYFDYEKDNPFNKVINYFEILLTDSLLTYHDIFFNKLIYIDDSYDYELFELEGNENSIYYISEKSHTSKIYHEISFNRKIIWMLSLKCNNKITKNEVSLFSLDYIYAAFGGFFQLFHSLFSFICVSYNEKCMDADILNYFNSDYYNIKKNSNININCFKNIRKHNIELININKSCNSERIKIKNNKLDIKFKSINVEGKIYSIIDIINFIKLYFEINLLKKILIYDRNNHNLFDLASYYNLYGLINEENLSLKIPKKITNNLRIIINDVEG